MEHFIWNIDPIALSFAGLTIHWYGILFASAITAGFYVMKWIYTRENISLDALDNQLIYAVVGIVVGARLGHCLFYDPSYYLSNPLKILAIWEGGLASHGGGLGVIIGMFFYHKKHGVNLLWLFDRLSIATAIFGLFVRSANFINSEIVGKPTDVPWAIIFQRIDMLPRHPAQLYEAIAYLCIFVILMLCYRFTQIQQKNGVLFGLFLTLIFSSRFALEFVKVKQAGYETGLAINTGQWLSIPFLVFGLYLLANGLRKPKE
ncbi:prolipoprotein diacylglyceryl transferase [Alteromonas sp. 5E99-2]|uniref:prolipoprotein diacylglyceryl transferase n=1 Tax=Alteromonas sp. 5E99-2 TaxID=2817683 RepID=UPI001A97E51B|nr:prolipoprotein diacylglyceryl transferase [Alteromonas sp. 5E99-2]MBO1254571.1 prolipoprotein diacylglyceryl transferase [Alteromonas sp. 5E99-2]